MQQRQALSKIRWNKIRLSFNASDSLVSRASVCYYYSLLANVGKSILYDANEKGNPKSYFQVWSEHLIKCHDAMLGVNTEWGLFLSRSQKPICTGSNKMVLLKWGETQAARSGILTASG